MYVCESNLCSQNTFSISWHSMHTIRFSMRSLRQLQLWQKCKRVLSRRLLLVNTGTCCVLYTVGDLLQQQIEGSEKIDWKRTSRMATLGFCMGPINHSWYMFLDRVILGQGLKMVGKKVLADQLVMAPICCSLFYIGKVTPIMLLETTQHTTLIHCM